MNEITRRPLPADPNISHLKDCKNKRNARKSGEGETLFRDIRVPGPLDQVHLLLEGVVEIVKSAAGNEALKQCLQQEIIEQIAKVGIIGSPSGLSPPRTPRRDFNLTNILKTDNDSSDLPLPTALPDYPPAWWKNRRDEGENPTPKEWLETHYYPYIKAKLLYPGFFQRDGQDKAFGNALIKWQKDNELPPHLKISTIAARHTKQVNQSGFTPADVPRIKEDIRLLQAALYRLA